MGIIHFTPSRIYIQSSGSLGTVSEKGVPISEDSKFTRPTIPGLSYPSKESPLDWLDIVERYTRCGLTFEKDKLIAIATLAKQIHLSTGEPYFSRLWQNSFHTELLWIAKRSNKRHKEIVAPSWSWAAVSGPIVFPKAFTSAEELDTVLTARAEVMHIVDPYDAVIDGKQMANLQWLNGLALLVLGGQVKMTLVSGMPTEGKNGQYIPML
jgi:hypothetical protein